MSQGNLLGAKSEHLHGGCLADSIFGSEPLTFAEGPETRLTSTANQFFMKGDLRCDMMNEREETARKVMEMARKRGQLALFDFTRL